MLGIEAQNKVHRINNKLMKLQSDILKAARMFPLVAAGKQGGNNDHWEQILQNFSDYLIHY